MRKKHQLLEMFCSECMYFACFKRASDIFVKFVYTDAYAMYMYTLTHMHMNKLLERTLQTMGGNAHSCLDI
jgi:hypothetical protein